MRSRIWHTLASCSRGCLSGVVGIFLLLGLVYWGYCWGWWGRTNLTLQYLFQCQCPAASEEVRYHPFTVLASACTHPRLRDMAPSGRYVLIEEERFQQLQWINVTTGQIQDLAVPTERYGTIRALTDHLLFIRLKYLAGYMLVDLSDGTTLELPHQFVDHQDLTTHQHLQNAAHVIVFDAEILALAPDYKHHPDQNLVLYTTSALPPQVTQQLTAADIAFTELADPYTTGPVRDDRFLSARYSHDGQLYALPDGIYHAVTQERLMDLAFPRMHPNEVFRPVGWTPDNRRVVYVARDPHLIGDSSNAGYSLHFLPVPQPIFLVEVPEELVPRR